MHFFHISGVKKGDRIAIYMPMIVEIVVAMLACSRVGAVHSVVVSNIVHINIFLFYFNIIMA